MSTEIKDLPERFRRKVEVAPDGCWLWTGAQRHNGYGHLWTPDGFMAAHRFAYQALSGPIPADAELDHLCRVRRCVNPDHLEPVARGENVRRGLRGYGARPLCRNGLHDITDPANVTLRANGQRQCRPCEQASWARSWERKKAARLLATGRIEVRP